MVNPPLPLTYRQRNVLSCKVAGKSDQDDKLETKSIFNYLLYVEESDNTDHDFKFQIGDDSFYDCSILKELH